jgi:hypothetical protein
MFRSGVLIAVVIANFVLFVAHGRLAQPLPRQPYPPALFQLGDFCCADACKRIAGLHAIETMALIVRDAYLKRPRRPPPR